MEHFEPILRQLLRPKALLTMAVLFVIVGVGGAVWRNAWLVSVLLWAGVAAAVFLHTLPAYAAKLTGAVAEPSCGQGGGTIFEIPRAEGQAAIYGDSRWASFDEMERVLANGSGIPVAEAYRVDRDPSLVDVKFDPRDKGTWGLGGQACTFDFDPDRIGSGHMIFVSGSGGYKTVSITVPAGLAWRGSLVVHDPSREAGPMLADYRESLGRKVVLLDPQATERKGAINVMEPIDKDSPTAQIEIRALAATLGMYEPGKSDSWVEYRVDLIETLLAAEVFEHAGPAGRAPTLRAVYARFAKGPKWLSDEYLAGMAQHAESLYVRQKAARFVGMAAETWTSITNGTATVLSWLGTESLCALVSDATFSLSDLPKGNLDVFVQIPLAVLRSTPSVSKVVIESLVGAMEAADGHHEERCLFLLDEAYQLLKGGGIGALERSLNVGRKAGVSVALLLQSESQLAGAFGAEEAQMWLDGVALRVYSCQNEYTAAKALSDACGSFTALEYSESENTSESESDQPDGGAFGSKKSKSLSDSRGRSVKPVKRALISPEEVMGMREDEGLFFVRGCRPFRASRPIFFRRPEMAGKVGHNRYAAKAAAETAARA